MHNLALRDSETLIQKQRQASGFRHVVLAVNEQMERQDNVFIALRCNAFEDVIESS